MSTNIKLPRVMQQLYGEQTAQKVLARCYEVDEFFGDWVSKYVCDLLWELPPLSLIDKSIVTVISLVVLQKEEQSEIHLRGLLNLTQNINSLWALLQYLNQAGYTNPIEKTTEVINKIAQETNALAEQVTLTAREQALIDLSALTALGNNQNTKQYIERLLANRLLSEDEMAGVFRHQMTYCGCPCTMNAFAMLRELQSETKLPQL